MHRLVVICLLAATANGTTVSQNRVSDPPATQPALKTTEKSPDGLKLYNEKGERVAQCEKKGDTFVNCKMDSGVTLEKLVSDGTPLPAIASYGMTSGSTPREGVTAQMLYYDPAKPSSADQIAGKILVCQTAQYPNAPYSDSFLDNYTFTDYEWRSPGKWYPLFTPPLTNVTTSYHCRWVWSQLNQFAAAAIKGKAAGMVVVYDLSPGAAFGLAQRSVYTPDGRAGRTVSSIPGRSPH